MTPRNKPSLLSNISKRSRELVRQACVRGAQDSGRLDKGTVEEITYSCIASEELARIGAQVILDDHRRRSDAPEARPIVVAAESFCEGSGASDEFVNRFCVRGVRYFLNRCRSNPKRWFGLSACTETGGYVLQNNAPLKKPRQTAGRLGKLQAIERVLVFLSSVDSASVKDINAGIGRNAYFAVRLCVNKQLVDATKESSLSAYAPTGKQTRSGKFQAVVAALLLAGRPMTMPEIRQAVGAHFSSHDVSNGVRSGVLARLGCRESSMYSINDAGRAWLAALGRPATVWALEQ